MEDSASTGLTSSPSVDHQFAAKRDSSKRRAVRGAKSTHPKLVYQRTVAAAAQTENPVQEMLSRLTMVTVSISEQDSTGRRRTILGAQSPIRID